MGVKSSKPKKQRLFFHSMPLHKRQKSLAANLSKTLRKSLGKRSLSLRKGDKVKVMRGQHRNFEGKVLRTDYKKQQVFLEKLTRKRSDGTEKPIPLQASNLAIVDINKSDVRRIGKERKIGKKVKKEEKVEKPSAKIEKNVKKEEKVEKTSAKKGKKVKKSGEKGRKKESKKA